MKNSIKHIGLVLAASLALALTNSGMMYWGADGRWCTVAMVYSGYFVWLASLLALLLGSVALASWGGKDDAMLRAVNPADARDAD